MIDWKSKFTCLNVTLGKLDLIKIKRKKKNWMKFNVGILCKYKLR